MSPFQSLHLERRGGRKRSKDPSNIQHFFAPNLNCVKKFECIYHSTPRPFSRPLKSSSLPSFINGLVPRHLLSLGLMQYQTGHRLAGRSIVLVHAVNRSNDTLALAIYIITHRIITCRERWCLRDLITYAILCVHRLNGGGGGGGVGTSGWVFSRVRDSQGSPFEIRCLGPRLYRGWRPFEYPLTRRRHPTTFALQKPKREG